MPLRKAYRGRDSYGYRDSDYRHHDSDAEHRDGGSKYQRHRHRRTRSYDEDSEEYVPRRHRRTRSYDEDEVEYVPRRHRRTRSDDEDEVEYIPRRHRRTRSDDEDSVDYVRGRRAARERSRSTSRHRVGPYYDVGRNVAMSDPGLIEYGDSPMYGNNYGPDYYGRPAQQDNYYSDTMVPVAAAAGAAGAAYGAREARDRSRSRSRSRNRRRSASSSSEPNERRRRSHHRHRRTRNYDEDPVDDVRDRRGGRRTYDEGSVEYVRGRRDNTHRSPRPEFRQAEDFDGNAITIDVPLQNTGGLTGFLSTKQIPRQTTAKWLEIDGELERRYHCEKIERIDVLSSHKYSTDGKESAVLHYKKSSRGSPDGQFRWMYGSILSVDFLPLLTRSAVTCKARLAVCEISRQVSNGSQWNPLAKSFLHSILYHAFMESTRTSRPWLPALCKRFETSMKRCMFRALPWSQSPSDATDRNPGIECTRTNG
jgi:hypothetical protein